MSYFFAQPAGSIAWIITLMMLIAHAEARANENQVAMADTLTTLCARGDLTSALNTACSEPALLTSDSVAALTPDELIVAPHSLLRITNGIQFQLQQQFTAIHLDGSPIRDQLDQEESLELPKTRIFTTLGAAQDNWDTTQRTPANEQEYQHWLLGGSHLVATPLRVGFALGAHQQETQFDESTNELDFNDQYFTLFANWFRDEFAVDSSLLFGRGNIESNRVLADGSAYSDTDFRFWSLQLNGRFYFSDGNWRYGPMASLTTSSMHFDALEEVGDSVWRVALEQQNSHSMQYVTGIHVQYHSHQDWGQLIPYGSLLRGKEFRDREQTRFGYFVELPQQALSVTRDNFDNYWTITKLGLLLRFDSRFSAFADLIRLNDLMATESYYLSLGFNLSL